MVVSRMGRSTNGKFAHRVVPFVLERMLHPDKAIKFLLSNDMLQWIQFHRFSLKNTSAIVSFLNLLCEDVDRLHDRFAIRLERRATPSRCSCCYTFLARLPPLKRGLQHRQDHNPIIDLADTWRRPGGILRRLLLRIGPRRPPQDDLAALHLDRDIPGIGLGIADERSLDLLLQVAWRQARLDRDEIGHAFDPCEALYGPFCK